MIDIVWNSVDLAVVELLIDFHTMVIHLFSFE